MKAGQDGALEAANRAITVAPDLPDGYRARGFVSGPIHWDFNGSRADFERALALDPDNPDSLSGYAIGVLRPLGHMDEAIRLLRKASQFDPLNARIWSGLGSTLAMAGETLAAREALDRSLEISPDQSFTAFALSLSFLFEGKPAEALAAARRCNGEIFRLTGVSLAEHSLGHAAESQKALDELMSKWGHGAAYQVAEVLAWRGETSLALEWLERADRQRDGGLANVKVDSLLRGLRKEPRYLAVLRKMNLPPE